MFKFKIKVISDSLKCLICIYLSVENIPKMIKVDISITLPLIKKVDLDKLHNTTQYNHFAHGPRRSPCQSDSNSSR